MSKRPLAQQLSPTLSSHPNCNKLHFFHFEGVIIATEGDLWFQKRNIHGDYQEAGFLNANQKKKKKRKSPKHLRPR